MFLRRLTINWSAPSALIRVTSALPPPRQTLHHSRPDQNDSRSDQVMDLVGNLSFAVKAMPALWMSPYA